MKENRSIMKRRLILESNSYTQSNYFVTFHVPAPVLALMKRGVEELRYLFLPEDTSGDGSVFHYGRISGYPSKIRGAVKGLVWIAISIAVAMTIGQLK
jgi:hypothetical protein